MCVRERARIRKKAETQKGRTVGKIETLTVRRLCVPALIDGAIVSSTKAFTFDISTNVSHVLS